MEEQLHKEIFMDPDLNQSQVVPAWCRSSLESWLNLMTRLRIENIMMEDGDGVPWINDSVPENLE